METIPQMRMSSSLNRNGKEVLQFNELSADDMY